MKTALILSGSLFLSSAAAFANPIMIVQEFRAEALAGPHVKLTYTYNYSGSPVGASTYGTSHSPWVQTGSTSRNTGSGSQSLPIYEMCDCHVPIGTHDYSVVLSYGSGAVKPISVTVIGAEASKGCESQCQAADAQDASVADVPISQDVSLDTPPEVLDTSLSRDSARETGGATTSDAPSATGGAIAVDAPLTTGGITTIDARPSTGGTQAVDAPMASGGSVTVDARPATGGTYAVTVDAAPASGGITATGGNTTPGKAKSGGCNFGVPGTTPSLPFLALLGLAVVRLRRRS